MTVEDQDAEVGRLVRERRDLRAHYEAHVSKLQSHGKLFSAIGKALTVRPQTEAFPARLLDLRDDSTVAVANEHNERDVIHGKYPDFSEIRQLLIRTKEAERRLSELESQLKAFGV
jgi:hypothetical protein